jgi:very-short-patch-repair endonuclease
LTVATHYSQLLADEDVHPTRQRWDDMERDIDLGPDGYLSLRFPAWLVRANPGYVARRTLEALRKAGYRGWQSAGQTNLTSGRVAG